jgi:3-phosphoshikimate 1-carboxyvinyltransferase
LSALVPGSVTLIGDEHMARRPIAELVEALRVLGVRVDCPTGCPPITVHGGRLSGGRVAMRGDLTSQYFSALMLVGVLADADVEVEVVGDLVSRPYVEITRQMVTEFGGGIDVTASGFLVHPGGYRGRVHRVEPDASSASYAFALAAGSGGSITVPGLGLGALQGDYAFVDLLEQAGARVDRSADETTVTGTGTLRGLDADLNHISDTVMTLAALGVVSTGSTRIKNVANIRIKETDRLLATVTELRRLGQGVESGADWLRIEPRPLSPASVECYADHRMAMAFAVLGALRAGVSITDPSCVSKTYPGFWDDLGRVYMAVGQPVPWSVRL